MAMTVAIDGQGVVTDAESTTGWARSGTIAAPSQESDIVLQGSYCVSTKASAKAGALYYDIGAGNELDFSSGGAEEGELIYFFINVTTLGGLNTIANGGLRIRIYTDTSNYADWYIMGSDTTERWKGGKGGFTCFAMDPTLTPTATTGTLNLASIRYFGIYIDNTSSAKSENLMMDTIAVGKGIKLTGTDTDGWDDMIDYCTAYATRAWGMIQEDETNEFVLVQGRIRIGDSAQTAATSLTADGRTFKWFCYEYYRGGNWYPLLPDGRHGLIVEDAASYTTTYQDGELVGTDAGRNGSVFIGTDCADTTFDLYGGNNAASVTKLYGATLRRVTGGINLGNDADHHVYSVTFDACAQVDPVGAPKFRNCLFQNTVHEHEQTLGAAIADDGGTQTDETTAANNATTNDMTLVPTTPAVNDAYYFGSRFQFGALEIDVSTAGATFVVAWEYWNGAWTTLTSVADGTNNFRNAGRNRVSYTWPTDWATTTVNSQGPFYYIRARVTTGGGTQALGEQAWIRPIGSGAALLWNANIDIQDCQFIANTHAENTASAIEHTTAGNFDYQDLTFSGNGADVVNSVDSTTEDSYATQDSYKSIGYSGTFEGVGQSFTVGAGAAELARVRVWLKKTGSPTGNAKAYVYAHSGTYGTSSIPTGTALAESNTLDVSTLTTSGQWVDFEFEDEVTLSASTNYVVTVEYSGGSAGNTLDVGYDAGGSHGGNLSDVTSGTWTARASDDMTFYVYTDSVVQIDNLGTSNASTDLFLGDPPGAVIFTTAKTLTITGLETGSKVYIYDRVGGQAGSIRDSTEASGTTFAHNYNYPGSDIPVIIHIGKTSEKILRIEYDMGSTSVDLPVSQETDRVYNNP